jgi:hypothetical protein
MRFRRLFFGRRRCEAGILLAGYAAYLWLVFG